MKCPGKKLESYVLLRVSGKKKQVMTSACGWEHMSCNRKYFCLK